MKYFFIRLEIQDGEHGYYSDSVLESKDETRGIEQAEDSAKRWYEDKVEVEEDTERKRKSYYFPYQQVYCWVNQLTEISKEHYDILKQYL